MYSIWFHQIQEFSDRNPDCLEHLTPEILQKAAGNTVRLHHIQISELNIPVYCSDKKDSETPNH